MRALLPTVAAVLAVVAVGCGPTAGTGNSASSFKGAQHDVAQTIEDLQTAGQNTDEGKICDQILAQALRAKLGNCRTVIKAALKDTDSFDLTVKAVTVNGNTATARVNADRGKAPDEVSTIQLVREGGRWKISSLG